MCQSGYGSLDIQTTVRHVWSCILHAARWCHYIFFLILFLCKRRSRSSSSAMAPCTYSWDEEVHTYIVQGEKNWQMDNIDSQYYSKLGKLHGSREGGITLFLLFIYHSFTKTRQKKSLAAGYSCKAARPRPGLLAFIHPQKASWNPKKLGSGSMGRERLFVTCPSAKALPYYDWA